MSTYFPKGEIARKWFVVDADGQTLGRLASRVARILTGKDSPQYTPFIDTGDHVIVINAEKVRITGLKADSKVYYNYSGFPGRYEVRGIQEAPGAQAGADGGRGDQGMLPHTKLGRRWPRKLKVYSGDKHPHAAQKPEAIAAVLAPRQAAGSRRSVTRNAVRDPRY